MQPCLSLYDLVVFPMPKTKTLKLARPNELRLRDESEYESKKLDIRQNMIYSIVMSKESYKFNLRPTSAQEALLKKTLELCRWTYNETLATRKNAWELEQKSVGFYQTKKLLPIWKTSKPELADVHSQVLQNVHERVELAFRAFFQRVKKGEKPGYPRFKGFGRYDSFTFPQYGNGSGAILKNNGLFVSKILI